MVPIRKPAQGAHAAGHLRTRNAVNHVRVEPRLDVRSILALFEVVAGPVERRHELFGRRQGRFGAVVRRGVRRRRVRIDYQQAHVREPAGRAELVVQFGAQPPQ